MYGFKKTLILLTKPGKLFALNSNDGSLNWSYFNPYEKILKVFVEQSAGSDEVLEIIAITESKEIHLDPLTGHQNSINQHKVDALSHNFMLIKNGAIGHNVIAVPKGAHSNEQKLKLIDNKNSKLFSD